MDSVTREAYDEDWWYQHTRNNDGPTRKSPPRRPPLKREEPGQGQKRRKGRQFRARSHGPAPYPYK